MTSCPENISSLPQLETYHLTDPDIDQSLHGHEGPIHVSHGTYFQEEPAQDLLNASIATGHEVTADAQDLHKDIRGLKGVGVFSVSLACKSLMFSPF